MLWRGNPEGRCVYLSRSMREFWGLGPEDCSQFEWASSLVPEDAEAVFGPFAQGMATQTAFICEGRYRRADGQVRVLRTRAHPYQDSSGVFAGMIGVNEDITELRAIQAELTARHQDIASNVELLSATAARLDLATRISGLAMSEHDGALRYTWSQNVPPECLGKTPSEFLGPEVGEPLERILQRVLSSQEPQAEEFSFLMGNQRLWCDIQAAPTTLADGRPGVIASALDVTARKLNEDKLQVLARELGHRVKNVFSVVQAVVRQSARGRDVPAEFLNAIDARLSALSHAQDGLLNMAGDRFSLATLLERQLSHLEGVALAGDADIEVPGKLAPYLALAVHELGTNALKYGSLSVPEGQVHVRWTQPTSDQVALVWKEMGGPKPSSGSSSGFGSVLLTRVFSAATGGTAALAFGSDGLEWTAAFPVKDELRMELE